MCTHALKVIHKTEFVIIGTKQQLTETYISTILIGNTDIVTSET